jgi:hypothetical protein
MRILNMFLAILAAYVAAQSVAADGNRVLVSEKDALYKPRNVTLKLSLELMIVNNDPFFTSLG